MNQEKSKLTHKKIVLFGGVTAIKGKLKVQLNSPAWYDYFLKMNCKPGDDIRLTVEAKKPKRTELQNNYYWLYLGLIAISTGYSEDDLHDWVKQDILKKGISEVFGVVIRKTQGTSDLNKSEFCEMMNQINEKTGVPLPDPTPFKFGVSWNEYHKLKDDQVEKYRKIKAKI